MKLGLSALAVLSIVAAGCSGSSLVSFQSEEIRQGSPPKVAADTTADKQKQKVRAPVFDPPGGTYSDVKMLTIKSATPGAAIYVSTNDGPFRRFTAEGLMFDMSLTLRAYATAEGLSDSDVVTETYEYVYAPAVPPTISPSGGTFSAPQTVTLNTSEPSGAIVYTLDGTIPANSNWSTNGTVYQDPIVISEDTTLTVITTAPNRKDSEAVTATFKFAH